LARAAAAAAGEAPKLSHLFSNTEKEDEEDFDAKLTVVYHHHPLLLHRLISVTTTVLSVKKMEQFVENAMSCATIGFLCTQTELR
jgi:hypothetical protein